jgi:Alpha-L-arabinofuranosidase B (ABFB) domain
MLLALPVASCDGSLRLVVVEQGESGNLSIAGKNQVGGSLSVVPVGGTAGEAGNPEPAQGGTAGVAGKPDDGMSGAGGAPDVPAWDAPPLFTASFVPYSYPEQYVRHLDGKGIIAVVDMASPPDVDAASFEMIPGLYEKKNDAGKTCVSFRAVSKIGTFFRHSGSRLYMQPAAMEPLFLADATFCPEPGMADPQALTFRSSNYPGRVIHLRSVDELWIDDVPDPMTPEFAAAATFYRTTALDEKPMP